MHIREEKGLAGIDIAISVMILTIFVALIASLIANINSYSSDTEKKTIATSYAVQEIERIKAQGYINDYNGLGIENDDDNNVLINEDIVENGIFTGYHKKILIKDYALLNKEDTYQPNLVKKITVEISYKSGAKEKNVRISTHIVKE